MNMLARTPKLTSSTSGESRRVKIFLTFASLMIEIPSKETNFWDVKTPQTMVSMSKQRVVQAPPGSSFPRRSRGICAVKGLTLTAPKAVLTLILRLVPSSVVMASSTEKFLSSQTLAWTARYL